MYANLHPSHRIALQRMLHVAIVLPVVLHACMLRVARTACLLHALRGACALQAARVFLFRLRVAYLMIFLCCTLRVRCMLYALCVCRHVARMLLRVPNM